ncbi:MAG: hypothetical protein HQL32_05525 [Planctomycetes bacterium]|nr:hypothetical protein [Planctomycetota bacterium]
MSPDENTSHNKSEADPKSFLEVKELGCPVLKDSLDIPESIEPKITKVPMGIKTIKMFVRTAYDDGDKKSRRRTNLIDILADTWGNKDET